MCGNFGLICFCPEAIDAGKSCPPKRGHARQQSYQFESSFLDAALIQNVNAVQKNKGGRSKTGIALDSTFNPMPVLSILEAQTRNTQVRGGQAGGYSTMEYPADFRKHLNPRIRWKRVRLVALKRTQLSQDLARHYHKSGGRNPSPNSVFTALGHTRFATASFNREQELHPHEWVAFHEEPVWKFDEVEGNFKRAYRLVGLHLSHNGDFDRFRAYGQEMVVGDCGRWLTRILHCSNPSRGDSAKIAGMMDLFRVMGRWGPAARLAWVRTVFTGVTDSCGEHQLSDEAPNTCPPDSYWQSWGHFIERVFDQYVNKVIIAVAPDRKKKDARFYRYYVDPKGEKALVQALVEELSSNRNSRARLNVTHWTIAQARSFFYQTVRDFLRMDLYSSLTEFLGRAAGSFGLQVHCTLEPGVVVIASKGQPMCMSYDPDLPNGLVLFGSEGDAMAVPVQSSGGWLSHRIDLNPKGEVVRLGLPRALIVGSYTNMAREDLPSEQRSEEKRPLNTDDYDLHLSLEPALASERFERNLIERDNLNKITLISGLEIRSYSMLTCEESPSSAFFARAVPIYSSPENQPRGYDLVGADLSVVPGVLSTIDEMWAKESSLERKAAQALGEHLVTCMQRRVAHDRDSIDLLIGGIEASLWVAEQWAADLRTVFPFLNITTTSANKLLDLSCLAPGKVYFPGVDRVFNRRINSETCVLLVSQSGQTFGTLHATTQMMRAVQDRLWLLTGCFSSQMEQTMRAYYLERDMKYKGNRVFTNFSGSRPAEPTSVAIAATWHTLTHLMMQLIRIVRERLPSGRMIHDWEKGAKSSPATAKKETAKIAASGTSGGPGLSPYSFSWSSKTSNAFPSKQITKRHAELVDREKLMEKKEEERAQPVLGLGEKRPQNKSPQLRLLRRLAVPISSSMSRLDDIENCDTPLKGVTSLEMPTMMMLSDGCIEDMNHLLQTTVVPALSSIVGHDSEGNSQEKKGIPSDGVHKRLVEQGKRWGAHINEPWNVLVLAAIYIIFCVGFGLPIFKVLAVIFLPILQSAGVIGPEQTVSGFFGQLSFSPFMIPSYTPRQIGYVIAGFLLQLVDAVWYVFIGKILTWACRYFSRRPMWARMGKRTIVIIDTPVNHQLLENFVSKLFAQSYSVCCPDVHGSSGLDHFVHRFTHRVSRGVLLAVGRPDGRLCNLSRSESAVLLGVKQAAFIRNIDYPGESSGPETVTIGHNDYKPNLGLAHHIVIHSPRRKFLDEYVYEHLYAAAKPHTGAMLRLLRLSNRTLSGKMSPSPEAGSESDPILELLRQADSVPMDLPRSSRERRSSGDTGTEVKDIRWHQSGPRRSRSVDPPGRTAKTPPGLFRRVMALGSDENKLLDHSSERKQPRRLSDPTTSSERNLNIADKESKPGLSTAKTPPGLFRRVMALGSDENKLLAHSSEGQQPHKRSVTFSEQNPDPTTSSERNLNIAGKGSKIALFREATEKVLEVDYPYSTHHIEPDTELAAQASVQAMHAGQDLVTYLIESAKSLMREVQAATQTMKQGAGEASNDPDERLAWSSRLDARTLQIQDSQVIVQQFYESRIASLERYIAFCVMFHAMAKACHKPWFRLQWDIAQSQSNLRVATTASPIGANASHAPPSYYEVQTTRQLLTRLRRGATSYL